MPVNVTMLRVVISCPSDVDDEKVAIREAIEELNNSIGKRLNVSFDVVSWDKDVNPGIAERPQDVINASIFGTFDIYLGVMYTRFGTDTGAALSGTEEEFKIAIEKWKENKGNVHIVFLFNESPINPCDIDTDQLSLVKKFKKDLSINGVLYKSFTSLDQLQQIIRASFSEILIGYAKHASHLETANRADATEPSINSALIESTTPIDSDQEPDEDGLLDLAERNEDLIAAFSDALSHLDTEMKQLGENIRERTEEINGATSNVSSIDTRAIKKIMDKAAVNLNDFVANSEEPKQKLSEALTGAIDTFGKIALILPDFNSTDQEDIKAHTETFDGFVSQLVETRSAVVELRNIIARLPRISTMYNKSRRKVILFLDELIEMFDDWIGSAKQVVDSLNKLSR